MDTFIKMLSDKSSEMYKILNGKIIKETINSSEDRELIFVHKIEFELNKKESITISKELNKLNDFKIYVNNFDFKIDELEEILKDELNEFKIISNKKILDKNLMLIFYKKNSFEKYCEIFFKKVKICNLEGIINKICISILEESDINIKSSIFSTSRNDKMEIYQYLIKEKLFSNQSIIAANKSIPLYLIEKYQKEIILTKMNLLSDKVINTESGKEFVISIGSRCYIKEENIEINDKMTIYLEDIIKFIFKEQDKVFDKLNIFKSTLVLELDDNILLNDKILKKVIDNSKINYQLFIEEKVKQFIEKKQKALDDYLIIQEEISKTIDKISDDLPNELLKLMGIIFSNFIIEGLGGKVNIKYFLLAGIIYLSIYIFFEYKKGWHFYYNTMNDRYEIIKNIYLDLLNSDIQFKEELKKIKVFENLEKLKQIEENINRILFIVLFMLALVFLIA